MATSKDMNYGKSMTISVTELQGTYSTLVSKMVISLFPITIFSIVQLIQYGNEGNYLLLLIGSIISIAGALYFVICSLIYGVKKEKGFIVMLSALGGMIPWIFGVYLVLIPGIWSLWQLSEVFSFKVLIQSLIFILLGNAVVRYIYKISEVARWISEGKLIVTIEK